jgi:hypothetical protein
VGWIVVGLVLVVAGLAVTFAAARTGGDGRQRGTAGGLVVGLGLGMVGWGIVAAIVGLFLVL